MRSDSGSDDQDDEGGGRESGGGRRSSGGEHALKREATTLDEEIEQARSELDRPFVGLFASAVLAGFSIGTALLLLAIIATIGEGVLSEPALRLLEAGAYATGFIIVVLGHTDLFTEYTTMALLPVLTGKAGLAPLARLWAIVYVGNILAVGLFAYLVAQLGPALEIVEPHVFTDLARKFTRHAAWVIVLSGALAGYLMGLLSWLVSAGRETTSQILFVLLLAGTLGFAHLHHCITGSGEVLAAIFAGSTEIGWGDFGHFLFWATLGNIIGAIVFATIIRFSVILGGSGRGGLRSA